MQMLPSKKIFIMLALLIVGIGALAWYGYNRGSNVDYTSDQNLLSVATSSIANLAASKIDTDNDDLPDWEETLYGTDPKNPDTDSDKTLDGKEIELGRNPLIKGPKDFLATKDNPTATSTVEEEKLTLTDSFARGFFTQYMNAQQSGAKITPENVDQFASNYLKNTKLPTISAKQYSEADLSLANSDQVNILTYKNAINAIFTKYWPKEKNNELIIMQKAFTNNDTKALSSLTPIISAYQNTLRNILGLSVPKLAVSTHLNLVNSLSTYIETLKMIQQAYTDPLTGLIGLNSYSTSQLNTSVSIVSLQMYLINSLK